MTHKSSSFSQMQNVDSHLYHESNCLHNSRDSNDSLDLNDVQSPIDVQSRNDNSLRHLDPEVDAWNLTDNTIIEVYDDLYYGASSPIVTEMSSDGTNPNEIEFSKDLNENEFSKGSNDSSLSDGLLKGVSDPLDLISVTTSSKENVAPNDLSSTFDNIGEPPLGKEKVKISPSRENEENSPSKESVDKEQTFKLPCLRVPLVHESIEIFKSHSLRNIDFEVVVTREYCFIPLLELPANVPEGTIITNYEFHQTKSQNIRMKGKGFLTRLPSMKKIFSPILRGKSKKDLLEVSTTIEPTILQDDVFVATTVLDKHPPIIGNNCQVHKSAYLSENVILEDGCIVESGVSIVASPLSGGIKIGSRNIIKANVSIVNDLPNKQLVIGSGNIFNREAKIYSCNRNLLDFQAKGEHINSITIGDQNSFGSRSSTFASIGSHCIIASNARIRLNIPDDYFVHSNGTFYPVPFVREAAVVLTL